MVRAGQQSGLRLVDDVAPNDSILFVPITSIGPPEFIIHAIGTGANTQCRYGEHSEPGLFPQRHRRCVPAKDELVLANLDKVDGIWTGQLLAA